MTTGDTPTSFTSTTSSSRPSTADDLVTMPDKSSTARRVTRFDVLKQLVDDAKGEATKKVVEYIKDQSVAPLTCSWSLVD